MFRIIIYILLCACSAIYGQSERSVFHGIISDEFGVLPDAHVINITTKKATYTLNNGSFEIFAQENDSLKITSIGYKTEFIKVKAHNFGIQTNRFKLQTDITQLEEVEIKNNNLTGMLTTDAKKATEKPVISAESLKLPFAGLPKLSPAERKLNLAQGGSNSIQVGLFSSVSLDLIINSISGRLRKAKKMKEYEDNDNDEKEILNSLSMTSYIKKDLKIDSSDVPRFINFYQQDKTYRIEQKSELRFLEFLRKKSIEFKKLQKKE